MKSFVLFILVIVLSFPTLAQADLFSELTEKYMDENGFSASQITSDMFDLYLKKKNVDKDSPVYEALNNLDKILVVSQSKLTKRTAASPGDGGVRASAGVDVDTDEEKIYQDILGYYKQNDYSLFKTEKKMGEDVKVYLKKNQDRINSLALITNSSVSTTLIELQGEIDLSTVSELSKAFNLNGLENLYKINNSGYFVGSGGSAGVTVYSRNRIEALAERQREMEEHQRNISKEQERQMERQAHEMAQRQEKMAERYREMAERYQRQPIFLTEPGDTNTVFYIDGKKVDKEEVKELDSNDIKSIEVNKSDKKNGKSTIRIKTK